MKPDPNTKEGREEIQRRIEKRREEAKEIRKTVYENLDDEPSGAYTNPTEIDRYRDRGDE